MVDVGLPSAAIVVFCLFPFYWLINISLKTGSDLSARHLSRPTRRWTTTGRSSRTPTSSPRCATARSWRLITTALALVVGSFCAYALARLKLRGKFVILAHRAVDHDVPADRDRGAAVQAVVGHRALRHLIGLIIPYLTFALPLAIYILVSFFREIPKDLEEAALVDGATRFQAFRKVVVPLAAPGLATAGILTFIAAWNEFLLAVTLTATTAARTVPAEIAFFTGATEFRSAREHRGRLGGHLGPADRARAALPEAHRGRPHRRRGQGLSNPRRVPAAKRGG